jgi:hypothetical protein
MKTKFKLGKLPPKIDKRTLKMSTYFKYGIPAPPEHCYYYNKAGNWGVLGNDRYGDCTFAAVGHAEQCWTANVGRQCDVKEADIVKAYLAYTKGADGGAAMLEVLNLWRQGGIIGKKIEAYVSVDKEDIRSGINLFGGIYLGLALPNYVMSDPLGVPWTRTALASKNSRNGHCVQLVGYDRDGLWCISWGCLKFMSNNFLKKYTDEAYAILSPDWFKDNQAPNGFDYQSLKEDLNKL